jgi:Spy/CpxP family protein refolding chaperone
MHSFHIKKSCIALLLFALLPIVAAAQDTPQPASPAQEAAPAVPPDHGGPPRAPMAGRGRDRDRGPGFHMGPSGRWGRWWDEPGLAQRIGITADQRQKMDDIFNSTRLKLIDLKASLEKEEVSMEPLVQADSPDENKVLAQIDRVAQARAELEKANTRMLFELRHQLTHEQWVKLQADRAADRGPRGRGPGGPGPGGPGPGSRLEPPDGPAPPPPAE